MAEGTDGEVVLRLLHKRLETANQKLHEAEIQVILPLQEEIKRTQAAILLLDPPVKKTSADITDDEIVEVVRQLAAELGHRPKAVDISERLGVDTRTVSRRLKRMVETTHHLVGDVKGYDVPTPETPTSGSTTAARRRSAGRATR